MALKHDFCSVRRKACLIVAGLIKSQLPESGAVRPDYTYFIIIILIDPRRIYDPLAVGTPGTAVRFDHVISRIISKLQDIPHTRRVGNSLGSPVNCPRAGRSGPQQKQGKNA